MVERAVERVEVRAGVYHDSVALMQASRTLATGPGVLAAQVAMGTDLNRDVLTGMGFALPPGIGPNELVVAVRAVDDGALDAALAAVGAALAPPAPRPGAGHPDAVPHRTVGSALRAVDAEQAPGGQAPGARLAVVSVPGQHAFTEAMDALEHGAHVLVFSDNVPVGHEVRLKAEGAARGLLVMGPDCGTAVVAGVGLGFANVVLPGPVGIVAASGTGAQQLLGLLDGAGVGVTHCLGVGGRDLSAAVGGASARQALALLDADPGCELIVLVSKPPDPDVERELRLLAETCSTPVQFALLGPGRPDLTAAARAAVEAVGGSWQPARSWPAPRERTGRYTVLRGAFCGGTLCDEAMVIASTGLGVTGAVGAAGAAGATGPIASNIPLDGAPRLAADLAGGATGHAMVDFGDDDLTRGRPHPMIDGSLRTQWIQAQAETAGRPVGGAGAGADGDRAGADGDRAGADGDGGDGVVLLLDVVLGHGAHPDPAAELAPALAAAHATAAARGVELAVVVSLCGTGGDPQGLVRQAEALRAAGASVHRSNADAAREALELLA